MTDRFKFRCWLPNKGMYYASLNDMFRDCVHIPEGDSTICGGGISTVFVKDDAVVMQFTGRTDKNGKEIYEGDILELLGEQDGGYMQPLEQVYGRYDIQWKNGGYIANPITENMYDPYSNDLGCFIDDERERVEIVGNIFENKQLLTI